MPEYHPGTDVEIPDNVPTTGFRNQIPNPKRYTKHNKVTLDDVAEAAFTGDVDKLEEMLATGNEKELFNGDINAFQSTVNPLHLASMAGQTECVELLLQAKADPHIKESMPFGKDPADGRTALDFAKEWGHDDIMEVLEQAQKDYKYGWYLPVGKGNNAKQYGCWEFGTAPAKDFFSGRPGTAELCGFDPMKYGTGPLKQDDIEVSLGEVAVPISDKAGAKPKAIMEDTIPTALVFPGQGSQYTKMMSNVSKDIPAVVTLLEQATAILGWDVLDFCLTAPDSELEKTDKCQPIMYVAGMAGFERLKMEKKEASEKFRAVAGLSLGEYTALTVAGVFSFEDGLKLVDVRGKAMAEAAKVGDQAMVSVAGLARPELAALCKKAASEEGGVCEIANELFPNGYSCAGNEKPITKLKALADGAGALQAKVLKAGGGFHTVLMEPAKAKLSIALDEMLPKMKPPNKAVYMNTTGQALPPGTDPKNIVELLKKQLVSPVLWEQSMKLMIEDGITEFFECGPMKQLKAMMKRINQKVWQTTSNMEV